MVHDLKRSIKGILLFRMSGERVDTKIKTLKEVLFKYGEELAGKFTVVTVRKVRIKNLDD